MGKYFVRFSIVCLVLLSVFMRAGFALAKGPDKAPGFALKNVKNMAGGHVTLSSLEGKVVLLNIFTTT
jgi:hypothetical protein